MPSSIYELPPLPQYELRPLPFLIPPIPDKLLTLLLPIAAYWILSMIFHWIDTKDYFSRYRLHTPAEVLKRNHVSRWDVMRDVVIQQAIQTLVGTGLGMFEPDDFYGKDDYNVSAWALRLRKIQRTLPGLLSLVGIDAPGLAEKVGESYPFLAGAIRGGIYPFSQDLVTLADGQRALIPAFCRWEMILAKTLYWYAIPALQFGVAILFVDTWQYFLHRAMHMNKWLYTTFHSRHHKLYVPYAFGALYNHPIEGLVLDTVGASLAYLVAGFSTRQGMWFFTCSTIKTVDDHCGYALPWDPLQHLTSNNAGYHDVHHQSWGIKTNFSQPFFTFWDRLLGTVWTGGDVSARYERSRIAAQRKVDQDSSISLITKSPLTENTAQDMRPYQVELESAAMLKQVPMKHQQPAPPPGKAEQQAAGSSEQVLEDRRGGGRNILIEEAQEEIEAQKMLRRSARRRTGSSLGLAQSDGLRGLTERVTSGIHSRTGGILGMESGR